MARPHVAALGGSLRGESYTVRALELALDAAGERGATTDVLDLRTYDLPPYDPGADDAGDAPALREALRAADAVVLGTPVYHGSYASPVKTALDYSGFDEFEEKTVGLLAVAGGAYPVLALDHLQAVCRALGAWVLPHQAGIPNGSRRFEDGRLVDEDLRERVETLGRRVVDYATIEPGPRCFEREANAWPGHAGGTDGE